MMLWVTLTILVLATLLPEYQFDDFDDLKTLSVGHALFGGEVHTLAHAVPEYFKGMQMTQGERVNSIRDALFEAIRVFSEVGLPVFIESATLIGYLRHGDIVPWDNDADIGFYVADCQRLFPIPGQLKEAVQRNLDSRFQVLGLDTCEHGERVHGQVVDKTTGFYVDMFAYADVVGKLEPWQSRRSAVWLKRVGDEEYANLTFPWDVLFPLKTTAWFGRAVNIPSESVTLLNYEYGSVLAEPLLPWKLMYYSHASKASLLLSVAAAILSYDASCIAGVGRAIWRVKGGLKVITLFIAAMFGSSGSLTVRAIISTIATASLVYDLLPWLSQLKDVFIDATNLSGDNMNPKRTQTVCIPGTRVCLDF